MSAAAAVIEAPVFMPLPPSSAYEPLGLDGSDDEEPEVAPPGADAAPAEVITPMPYAATDRAVAAATAASRRRGRW